MPVKDPAPIALRSDTHHFLRRSSSNKLLVISSATGTKPGRFNLWSLRDVIPHNILFLRVPTNDWYQSGVPGLGDTHDETVSAIRLIAAEHGIDDIYTCGSSMGAYSSILYAADLDCPCLAFSPETMLGLPHSRSAKMMPTGSPVIFPDLHDKIRDSKGIFHILSGEADPVDMWCADSVKNLPNVHITTFPKDAHTVMRSLVGDGKLVPLLWSFLANAKPDAGSTGRLLNSDTFARDFYHGWVAYQDRDNATAKAALERCVATFPLAKECHSLLAGLYIRLKDFDRSQLHALNCIALDPNDAVAYSRLAHAYRRRGYLEEAIELHAKILEKWPDTYQSHFDLYNIYLARGDQRKALLHIVKCTTLKPKNEVYQKALEDIRGRRPPPMSGQLSPVLNLR